MAKKKPKREKKLTLGHRIEQDEERMIKSAKRIGSWLGEIYNPELR